MRRLGWIVLLGALFFLAMCLGRTPYDWTQEMDVEAGVPENIPPIDDVLLQKFLKSLADHLNTLECLTTNPNGSILGTHGELKCAAFGGDDYICMNVGTGPAKTTEWTCLNIGSTGASPTTGIFCAGTLSTSMGCEQFRGRIPVACTVNRIDATVTTAPTGSTILIDVNECTTPTSCTSIWNVTQSNRLTISTSAFTASQTTFDDNSIALGNYIGFDIDQIGSTVAGNNLTVTVVCT